MELEKKGQMLAQIDARLADLESSAAHLKADAAQRQASNETPLRYARASLEVAEATLRVREAAKIKGPVTKLELDRLALEVTRMRLGVEQALKEQSIAAMQKSVLKLDAKTADARCDRHRILAPAPGVVGEVYRAPGEWIRAGEPICRMVQMDRVHVEGFAPFRRRAELINRDVSIDLAQHARPDLQFEFVGKITSISPEVKSGNVVQFWAEFDNHRGDEGWALLPGMEVVLQVGKAADAKAKHDRELPVKDNEKNSFASDDVSPRAQEPPQVPDEIASLQELVDELGKIHKRIEALQKVGARGGEIEKEAAARFALCIARGRLAWAKADKEESVKWHEKAVDAADLMVRALKASYLTGDVGLDELLKAQVQRTEAKLKLSQLKRQLGS
jgi:biotin carboxyl carrier protein